MDQPQSTPTLRDYFAAILRRKLIILLVFVGTTAVVTLAALYVPPVFTAQSTLLVKFGREFIYRPEVGTMGNAPTFKLEEMVNSEVEILNSRDLARQVIEELGVESVYPEIAEKEPDQNLARGKAVSRFQDRLSVMAVLESSVIRISFEHEKPEIAAKALNLLVERFEDKHLEVFRESKSNFLGSQLEEYEGRLEVAEEALEYFKQEHKVYQLEGQKAALLQQRSQLEVQLQAVELRIAELRQKLSFLNGKHGPPSTLVPLARLADQRKFLSNQREEVVKALKASEFKIAELERKLAILDSKGTNGMEPVTPHPGAPRSRAIDEALVELLRLELKEKELLKTYRDGSRQVAGVRREIQQVKSFLKDQGETLERIVAATIRQDLTAQEAVREAAREQLRTLEEELSELDHREFYQEVWNELAPLEGKKDKLIDVIGGLTTEIQTLDRHEKTLRDLERQVTLNEANYQTYSHKFEEARISEELDRQKLTNIKVIEKASRPISPSGLSKKMKIALGGVVGLLAGITIAFFAELLKH